jgi:hypothetical protein
LDLVLFDYQKFAGARLILDGTNGAAPARKAPSISLLIVLGVREDGQKVLSSEGMQQANVILCSSVQIEELGGVALMVWNFMKQARTPAAPSSR